MKSYATLLLNIPLPTWWRTDPVPLLNPKRWSLHKRSLIIAACAVGATAVVIAGIFTFALIWADFISDRKAQYQIAAAALHIIEHDIGSRRLELKNVAAQLSKLEADADLPALLSAVQFGEHGYVWIGVADEAGRVVASTGSVQLGQSVKDAAWFGKAMKEGSALSDDVDEASSARLPGRSDVGPFYLLHISQKIEGKGVLNATFLSELAEHLGAHVLNAMELDKSSVLAIESPRTGKAKLPDHFSVVRVRPRPGSILHELGWELVLAQPPEPRTVPNYALCLAAIALAVGVAGAARGIHWASKPALLLADAASQRLEVEALLECGEVPPDLETMSRHIISLHRVSEQRTAKLEEMLQEMISRFHDLTANFPGVVYRRVLQEDGTLRYLYISPSCQKYYGVEDEAVLADANVLFRNFHPDDVARVRNLIRNEQGRSSGVVLAQYRVKGSDGVVRWMQSLSEPHRAASGELVWEGVAVDISALKAAEARTLELRQEDQQARRKADAENEAKSRFLAVMSHEIRNPLNSIAGYARLLQERAGEQADIRQYAHVIEQSSGHLALLVNDVLDFSKIEAGRVSLDQGGFSLGDVAAFLRGQMAVLAAGKNIVFDVQNEIAAFQLVGDKMKLTQILMNLLTNAFKFTRQGRVVLSMSEMARADRHVTVRFKVTDTGIGMDADALSRIFQPFEQADASSSRRFGGTGLGLAIAQRLAKLMDSEIMVSSTAGEGSSFWLDIRFGIDTRAVARRASGRPSPPIVSGGFKVLIADDNEINSRLLSAMLRARGYACRTVVSGAEALAALEESPYGVLLLDIDMPEMDGYEVAQRIRIAHSAAVRDIRIVAITGNAFAEDVERALASGIDDHMAKPTDFDALFRLLEKEELARDIRLQPEAME
jgi:PAS domain S-box-containing protein